MDGQEEVFDYSCDFQQFLGLDLKGEEGKNEVNDPQRN